MWAHAHYSRHSIASPVHRQENWLGWGRRRGIHGGRSDWPNNALGNPKWALAALRNWPRGRDFGPFRYLLGDRAVPFGRLPKSAYWYCSLCSTPAGKWPNQTHTQAAGITEDVPEKQPSTVEQVAEHGETCV